MPTHEFQPEETEDLLSIWKTSRGRSVREDELSVEQLSPSGELYCIARVTYSLY